MSWRSTPPSEWGTRGIWEKQRSPEFATHNAAVIAHARKQADVPVILMGGSVGAIAAAGVATQLKEKGADGLILLSPWIPPKDKWPIPSFVFSSDFAISSWPDLAAIKGPILVIHHLDDNSNFSLPEYVPGLVKALSVASPPEVIGLRGGAVPSGNPCYPTGLNNFAGHGARDFRPDWQLDTQGIQAGCLSYVGLLCRIVDPLSVCCAMPSAWCRTNCETPA